MAEKLSDKLKGLFKRADVYLGKAIEKAPKSSKAIGPSQTQYKMFKAGQKTKSLLSGKLPSAAKFASATKANKTIRVDSRTIWGAWNFPAPAKE